MQRLSAILSLLFIGTVLSQLSYPECGSNNLGTLESVVIDGCQPSEVCILKKGTNLTLTMSFTTGSDISAVRNNVTANIANSQLPYVGINKDACLPEFGLKCPLTANTKNEYMNTAFVQKLYPTLSTTITYDLTDDKNNTIVCFLIKAKIVD